MDHAMGWRHAAHGTGQAGVLTANEAPQPSYQRSRLMNPQQTHKLAVMPVRSRARARCNRGFPNRVRWDSTVTRELIVGLPFMCKKIQGRDAPPKQFHISDVP